jgi:FtsH-binding integral membrane protein
MLTTQIILTILAIAFFLFTLWRPILYKPREDLGDIYRFIFYNGIELVVLVAVLVTIWKFL